MKRTVKLLLFTILILKQIYAVECVQRFHILSDFDDTIKTYHSKYKLMFLYDALFTRMINAGFNDLYKGMTQSSINVNLNECSDQTLLTILSASPRILYPAIKQLLVKYKFPRNKIILKPLRRKTQPFKFEKVKKVSEEVGIPMILIGDDTSKDLYAYQDFQIDYPKKVLAIYIHNVENKPPIPEQIKYITSFEIAYHEVISRRLSIPTAIEIGNHVLNSKDTHIIPSYAYCPTNWAIVNQFSGNDQLEEMRDKVEAKITEICLTRSIKNNK